MDPQSPGSTEPRIRGARAILAPTGMAAYHINGNTIHSSLHINTNKKELAPLKKKKKKKRFFFFFFFFFF